MSEDERRVGREALLELRVWMHDQDERALAVAGPYEVYTRLKVHLQARDREEAAHGEAVQAWLDEYGRWGQAVLADAANPFHDAGPGYLATDSPLLYVSREALVRATQHWALEHKNDPDFLRKSPSEVALYLLAKDGALAQLVLLGQFANGHLDYTPELDPTRYTLGEVAVEGLVGFIPVIGNIADAGQSATGISLTGHTLEGHDRVLLALGALVPFAHYLKAAEAVEVVSHLVRVTGRSAEEIEVLFRVAGHLGTEDAGELERIVQKAVRREQARYDGLNGSEPVTPGRPYLEEMMKVYREQEVLLVSGRTRLEGLFLLSRPIYGGYLRCRWPSSKLPRTANSRETHVKQVVELMNLLDSPLAFEGITYDETHKTHWDVEGLETSLDDYSEGLMGLFWHTFLGPPFVRLFGERLATLPPGIARDLGRDIWLIQPYPKPADALTQEGQAREQALIDHLGKECFLDHERQLKATQRPDLPFIDVEAALREHDRPKYEKEYGKGSRQVEVELKLDALQRWARRHPSRHYPTLWSDMNTCAREHQNDPDFLEISPEKIAEEARARFDSRPPIRPRLGSNPELDRVRDALGEPASQALQAVGGLSGELEARGGEAFDALDPEMRTKLRGLEALAQLLTPAAPAPEDEAPATIKKPPLRKKRSPSRS